MPKIMLNPAKSPPIYRVGVVQAASLPTEEKALPIHLIDRKGINLYCFYKIY
jgi:hypothetical protein